MLEDLVVNLGSLDDTARLGVAIGNISKEGDCICLSGNLGAGKTTLTQSIAIGLQVPPHCYITSPTFAMMHVYSGRMALYHMDFYRLNGSSDIIDLGFEEYFYLDGLTVIEWAEVAVDILPKSRVEIDIKATGEGTRKVHFFTENVELAERYKDMLLKFCKS